ncbi:MAG: hypothetical protein JSS27_12715 [Planctomycetes bacterium]|nr:hypothetical protein [Planctomycetota bacterium]
MADRVNIEVPRLGLDAVSLSLWYIEVGELITEGDRVVELLADGVTIDVVAPASGILVDILVDEEDPVTTGQILGVIECPPQDG